LKTAAVSKLDYEKAKLAYENSQNRTLVSVEQSDSRYKTDILRLEVTKNKANLASQQYTTSSFYEITSKVDGVMLQIHKTEGELIKRGEQVSGDWFRRIYCKAVNC
jgi:acetyl/propionyl-CoA carboxylase alpha subunit